MRLKLVEFVTSFAFVELGEFMGPSANRSPLFLVLAEGLVVCGSTVPERVDEVLGLAFEGLLAQFHQQGLVLGCKFQSKGRRGRGLRRARPERRALAAGALASLARFLSDSGGAGASTTLSVASVRAAMACARGA